MTNELARTVLSCRICRCWFPTSSTVGECRRYPPTIQPPACDGDRRDLLQRSRFPLTVAEDFCGEFEARR